jgi:hypothetical protein
MMDVVDQRSIEETVPCIEQRPVALALGPPEMIAPTIRETYAEAGEDALIAGDGALSIACDLLLDNY